MRTIKKGATDQTVYVEILDSSSTTGARKTGLVFNTAGLTAYYVRNGGSATAITLATLAAANSAHSDGGFKEVDATNMPGIYRLDLPDAAVASGADSVVITVKGATGGAQVSLELQLVDNTAKDVYDRLGAPAGASVSADIATIDTNVDSILVDTGTDIPATLSTIDGRIDTEIATLVTNVGTILTEVDTEVAAIKAKTDNLPTDPADQSLIVAATDALATLIGDVPTNAELATALGTADDAVLTQIALVKAKTDLIPGTIDGKTFAEIVTLIAAVLLGKASGLATTTAVYRAIDDSKARVTATVDADGNRTAVTLDAA